MRPIHLYAALALLTLASCAASGARPRETYREGKVKMTAELARIQTCSAGESGESGAACLARAVESVYMACKLNADLWRRYGCGQLARPVLESLYAQAAAAALPGHVDAMRQLYAAAMAGLGGIDPMPDEEPSEYRQRFESVYRPIQELRYLLTAAQ